MALGWCFRAATASTRRWLPGNADGVIAVSLAVAYTALLLATAGDIGYARDEGFYFAAADRYGQWFAGLLRDPLTAIERSMVDRYWAINHEHPALMKSLFALSHRLLHEGLGWFERPGSSYRLPAMMLGGAALAATYSWGRRHLGRLAALAAALSLGALPRFFFHAHLACFDVPVMSLWLLTLWAYSRALERPRLARLLLTGVLFGLLLDTKHNAWLLPPALAAHAIALHVGARLLGRRWPLRAWALPWVSMVGLGAAVLWVGWPWLWFDTWSRLGEWASFHLRHVYYNMEFLGRTYYEPPMPRSYAPLMTLATVPLVTLLLASVGAFGAARSAWVQGRRARLAALRFCPRPWSRRERDASLWAVGVLAAYAPWLSSTTPIFGGTKHWLTAYPFVCLFAGWGVQRLLDALSRGSRERVEHGRRASVPPRRVSAQRFAPRLPVSVVRPVLLLAVTIGPISIVVQSHPWGLSSYTPVVGGAMGAANLGLNRSFWGHTTRALSGPINAQAAPGATVYIHDTARSAWQMLQRDGTLRSDLRPTLDIARSELALYHHEPHMGRVEYQIWVDYRTAMPSAMALFQGVPVVWLYRRANPGPLH